jgi:hypothetical protein
MKVVLTAALVCSLATSARAADAPDSWAALSARPQAPFAGTDDARAFSGGSDWRAFKHDDRDGKPWSDHDDDRGKGLGHGDFGDEGDDLEKCVLPAPVPEPPSWLALAFGAALLGFARLRKVRQE